jgi:hypothetical protein
VKRPHWAAALALAVMVSVVATGLLVWRAGAPASFLGRSSGPAVGRVASAPPEPSRAVYVHYYLWWTARHWRDKLGPLYPYASAPPPLPGRLDALGCNPQPLYPGAEIVDLPAGGLYDQERPSTFDDHIDLAVRAGVAGFLVSWQGTGAPHQTPASSGYNSRLDTGVSRVDSYNAAHRTHFGLGLAFAAFGNYSRPADEVTADLTYFAGRYGRDPAFHNQFSSRPVVMWLDSRKFQLATVEAVSGSVRGRLYVVGDETEQSWPRDGRFLDATSYYWSTENPWTNPRAGPSLGALATQVRNQGKRWFAPLIAGYNKQLQGGTCVPRRGTETLSKVWEVNGQSRPDAWFAISWNELVENTYVEPSAAYGSAYLDALSALIRG